MSRIRYDCKKYQIFYEEFVELETIVSNCGNDVLELVCDLTKIPQSLIDVIRKWHVIDFDKTLTLIDEEHGEERKYTYIKSC